MYHLTTSHIFIEKPSFRTRKKQLSVKNDIRSSLTSQLITKSLDATKNINSSCKYHPNVTNNSNTSNHDDNPLEKSNDVKTTKELIIIGDFTLNNINCRWLSKFIKVEVLSYPGATNSDIVNKIDDV